MGQLAPMPSDPWLLVLCHEFPPAGGGCGRNLRLLCLELAKRGIRLEVWTAGFPGNGPPNPFAVKRFDTGRKAVFETSLTRILRFGVSALAAGKNVASPPVALFSAMGFPAGGVGALLNRRWNVPHYVWYHGTDVHGGKAKGPGLALRIYLRWIFRHSQGSFFVSGDLRSLAEKAGSSPCPRLLPSSPAPEMRVEAGSESPTYFLWAGRLEKVKRPLLLIEALRRLQKKGELPPMRIAGEGKVEQEVVHGLSALGASPPLRLERPIPGSDMPRVLRGAIAVILTSSVEGFSTLLLEAACQGVPAIACDAPGVREFIRHEKNGLLVPNGDSEALAEAMLRFWRDRKLRDALGEVAKRDAEAYTPEANAETLLAAFREEGLRLWPQPEGMKR